MLRFEALALAYGSRTILEDIDLAVAPGEVVALLGPNGAGKSTLIRAACGALAPERGRVLVGGADLRLLSPGERARRIAVVPQGAELPEAFTVEQSVLLGRAPHQGWLGRVSAGDREATEESLARTGLQSLRRRRLGELSGGERQLVLIARALAQSASILLFDEPTAQLDLAHEARILGLARSLARGGEGGERRVKTSAVLLALHDLTLAARYADRAALLSQGKIRALGRPEEVLRPEFLEPAYGAKVRVFPDPVSGAPVIVCEGEKRT